MISHHRGLIPFVCLLSLAAVGAVAPVFVASRRADRFQLENRRLQAENGKLKARVTKLEAELPPPHMWNMFTDASGERWAEDPLRPWLKPIPIAEWWRNPCANGLWEVKERSK